MPLGLVGRAVVGGTIGYGVGRALSSKAAGAAGQRIAAASSTAASGAIAMAKKVSSSRQAKQAKIAVRTAVRAGKTKAKSVAGSVTPSERTKRAWQTRIRNGTAGAKHGGTKLVRKGRVAATGAYRGVARMIRR